MIDYLKAKDLVLGRINSEYCRNHQDDEVVILDEYTISKEYGWIFFYQSRKCLEGNDKYMLFGNGPVLVLKNDGSIVMFGTAHPTEYYIEQYENGKVITD